MTTTFPPGRDAPKTDGSCFNCGSHDHFTMNCPESVRQVPYGAAIIRLRNANGNVHGSSGRSFDNSKSKGGSSIVVTKYAPPAPLAPPPMYPPPTTTGWSHSGSYPPPPVPPLQYGQQPPQMYPPPHQAQQSYAPPYPPANTGYGPPIYPPHHTNGGYNHPPPGPPGPPGPHPPYGQYGQTPYQSAPPPSAYGPPGAYAPPSYAPPPYPQAPQPNYQGPPPPGYPPPNYGGPPAPNFQGPSGHGYNGPPMPPPPPSAYPSGYGGPSGPPPPVVYPPSTYTPNSQPPAPYLNPYPPAPPPNSNWQKEPGSHKHQRHQRGRRPDKGNKNKNDRRGNDNDQRGRPYRDGASNQRSASASRQRSPKPCPVVPAIIGETPKTEDAKTNESKTDDSDTVDESVSKEDQFDADTLWDFEKAFIELDTKPADSVGKPLAAEWNDDPTIPPAYNAKCIKTEYYDPNNPDAFLASVRDTKYWPALKRDPVFRFRSGMVAVQFPGSHHEYFTYHLPKRIGPKELRERDVLPGPSDLTLIDKPRHSHPVFVYPRHYESPSISVNGKRNLSEADDHNRDAKRPRNHGLDRSPMPRQPRHTPSRDVNLDADPWVPQSGETRLDSPHKEYSHSPGGYRLQSNGRLVPYDSSQRHDSGYHSSTDKSRFRRDDKSAVHLSPPPSARARERDGSRDRGLERDRGRDQDLDRARTRDRSWDRSRDRTRAPSLTKTRTRSRTRSPARSRSRTAAAESPLDEETDDDMDDLEYELLGIQRPRSPARKTVYKALNPRRPRPRTKVADAFSRRW